MTWNDVQQFMKKLSLKEGRPYRLPTEAEWEYAERAGSRAKYYWGDEINGEYLWYQDFSSGEKTRAVGRKKPNAWGLYDMLGNVWQWCGDWHDEKYYASSPASDPPGPASGTHRILRGGSWVNIAINTRVSIRFFSSQTFKDNTYGFRALLESP